MKAFKLRALRELFRLEELQTLLGLCSEPLQWFGWFGVSQGESSQVVSVSKLGFQIALDFVIKRLPWKASQPLGVSDCSKLSQIRALKFEIFGHTEIAIPAYPGPETGCPISGARPPHRFLAGRTRRTRPLPVGFHSF